VWNIYKCIIYESCNELNSLSCETRDISLIKDGACFLDVDGDNKCKSATTCSQLSYNNTICLEDHKLDSVGNNGPCTWINVFLFLFI
jgi:hypothetical protein